MIVYELLCDAQICKYPAKFPDLIYLDELEYSDLLIPDWIAYEPLYRQTPLRYVYANLDYRVLIFHKNLLDLPLRMDPHSLELLMRPKYAE